MFMQRLFNFGVFVLVNLGLWMIAWQCFLGFYIAVFMISWLYKIDNMEIMFWLNFGKGKDVLDDSKVLNNLYSKLHGGSKR